MNLRNKIAHNAVVNIICKNKVKYFSKFFRENLDDKVLRAHQVLQESKVLLVLEDPKENEDLKERLVRLDQRDRKEKLEPMVDLVAQVLLDHLDLQEIEVLQAYQVLRGQ